VLRRSKTDQEGEGMVKGLPYGSDESTCPVRAWRTWITEASISEGRAFRSVTRHGRVGESLSDKAIALVVQTPGARSGPRSWAVLWAFIASGFGYRRGSGRG